MVLQNPALLDSAFHALAHPVRREMLRTLAEGERSLGELASPFRMTFPAASKHVRVLERARLVRRQIRGRVHICRLEVGPLSEVAQWTENCRQVWEANFARLDSLLEQLKAAEGVHAPDRSAVAAPAPATRTRKESRRSPVRKAAKKKEKRRD